MEDKHLRLLATIDAVLGLRPAWRKHMSEPKVVRSLKSLQTIRRDIAKLQAGELPGQVSSERTAQINSWCDAVRRELLEISTVAELHLVNEAGKPMKLKVPHARAKPDDMLHAAEEFDATVRPHLPELVVKGESSDLLDPLHEAVALLEDWRTNEPNTHTEQKELRQKILALIRQGRVAIKLLQRRLDTQFRDDPLFQSAFKDAARARKKPGPPKAATTAIRQDKRARRRPPKRKPARPKRRDRTKDEGGEQQG